MDPLSTRTVHALAHALRADVVETHISWVLLTAGEALKIKKPVRFSFVDYSTLEKRRHFCEEELRLNRRLAAPVYLGIARITGTADAPAVDGSGPVLDYAVRMHRFPEAALFSEQLRAGALTEADVDELALRLARFHLDAPRAPQEAVTSPSPHEKALAALEGAAGVGLFTSSQAAELAGRIRAEAPALSALWQDRAAHGHVRECHGDLHLDNIVRFEGEVLAFDCIEFDPALRWIDVAEDAAFAFMDFLARGHAALGWRFLNAWLDGTGEHEAAAAIRFAVLYRALVRAHVESLRNPGGPSAQRYARLSLDWSLHEPARQLFITHGLPGSGKSFASQQLLQSHGCIRVRSDVERKRLFGLTAQQDSRALGLDIYTAEATRTTYDVLWRKAGAALDAGFSVILDAAFLRRAERDAARVLAQDHGATFTIIDCDAPLPVLRERLRARTGDASEADEQVLERLLSVAEPLDAAERENASPAAQFIARQLPSACRQAVP
jgi:aminoglycoside phosphotransferase family enzyme/predicted kinase